MVVVVARFDVLTVMLKIQVFSDVTPCGLVNNCWYFNEAKCRFTVQFTRQCLGVAMLQGIEILSAFQGKLLSYSSESTW